MLMIRIIGLLVGSRFPEPSLTSGAGLGGGLSRVPRRGGVPISGPGLEGVTYPGLIACQSPGLARLYIPITSGVNKFLRRPTC